MNNRQPKHHQTTQTSPDNPNIKNHHHRHRHCHHQSSSSPFSSSESHLSKGDNWPPPPWGRKQRCPSDPNRHLPEGDGIKDGEKQLETVKTYLFLSKLILHAGDLPPFLLRGQVIPCSEGWLPLGLLLLCTFSSAGQGGRGTLGSVSSSSSSSLPAWVTNSPLDSSLQPLVSFS